MRSSSARWGDDSTTDVDRVTRTHADPQYTVSASIDGGEIVAPHDFDFQLRHYVIAPELRDGARLVEVLRTVAGTLVKVDVESSGTTDQPRLDVSIHSHEPLEPSDVDQIRTMVKWRLGADEDLRPFYELVRGDPVVMASIAHNYGAKGKCAFSMFDAVIDVICAQNTGFRRLYAMRANLAAAFGDPFPTSEQTYFASPLPGRLAAAPLADIRACGVGYRDKYIKGVAAAVAAGFDIEGLKAVPRHEARRDLMTLPGVGPYTADLGLIIGARSQDAIFLDVYLKEVLRTFYFGGERVDDAELAVFAQQRWGPHRGLAWFYLTTNTEVWAREIGMEFRLKSGALSDPDPT
jgi:3-methyladenine DNA glycosylase/8-oxoguanine DNA glycosylase